MGHSGTKVSSIGVRQISRTRSYARPCAADSGLLGRCVDLTIYGELLHLRPLCVFAGGSMMNPRACYPRVCQRRRRALMHMSVLSRITLRKSLTGYLVMLHCCALTESSAIRHAVANPVVSVPGGERKVGVVHFGSCGVETSKRLGRSR